MRTPSKLLREPRLSPRHLCVISGLFFVLSTSFYSVAQQPPEQGKRGGPPPEAFEACETATQNDACTVDTKLGTISGTCQLDRRKKENLLCVPTARRQKRGSEAESGEEQDHSHGENGDHDHDAP